MSLLNFLISPMVFDLDKIPEHLRTSEALLFHQLREQACLTINVPKELQGEVEKYLSELFSHAEEIVNSDFLFYRARCHEFDQREAFPIYQMGAPPKHKTSQGRIQHQGQPVLYTATDADTAIAETRPSVDSLLTVGEFCPNCGESIRVLNLTRHQKFSDCFGTSSIDTNKLSNILKSVNFSQREFSRQAHSDQPGRYLDTIYISQLIREKGFDGVAYKSLLNEGGVNYAFFTPEKLSCTETWVCKVTSVQVQSEKCN